MTGQKQHMTELKFSLASHLDRPTSSCYFRPCMYNTRVGFACQIYFSRDQSSSKLIIFPRLETRKIQLATCETQLETRFSKFSSIKNQVPSQVSQLASDCELTFERYCSNARLVRYLLYHLIANKREWNN